MELEQPAMEIIKECKAPDYVQKIVDHITQIAYERDRFKDIHGDIDMIRGVLVVNFCKNTNKILKPRITLWENLKDIEGVKTETMIIKALTHLMKMIPIDNED